jgi:hypothetical protein
MYHKEEKQKFLLIIGIGNIFREFFVISCETDRKKILGKVFRTTLMESEMLKIADGITADCEIFAD